MTVHSQRSQGNELFCFSGSQGLPRYISAVTEQNQLLSLQDHTASLGKATAKRPQQRLRSLLFQGVGLKQWSEVVVSINGLNYWSQVVVSSSDLKQWSQMVVSNSGVKQWSQIVVSSSGVQQWSQILVSSIGLQQWCICSFGGEQWLSSPLQNVFIVQNRNRN